MCPTSRSPRRRILVSLARSATVAVAGLATLAAGLVLAAPASAGNRVTPGSFTGHGFDQCTAPTQRSMDAWLTSSPYWAVGIYISGDSRGCLSQPNLSATWVTSQLAKGWRLLPITLGPQASCTTRERYLRQVRISPSSSGTYAAARNQGRAEADKTIAAAQALGISAGSTLWYDLEAFATSRTDCRESALSFLSSWTQQLRARGYVSGVYSSAASGLKMLDDARVMRPGAYVMPDHLWVADWNGRADTGSSYVRSDGWAAHRRVHQYRGGHDETYGGVTINIDNNWVDLGRGSVAPSERSRCGGVTLNAARYPYRRNGQTGALVKAAQCLLTEQKLYTGAVDGVYDAEVGAAARRYRAAQGLPVAGTVGRRVWVAMLAHGTTPLLKYGAASDAVRRVQRSLNAADGAGLAVTGVFEARTTAAVKRYQRDHTLTASGVVTPAVWTRLLAGQS
ncbi:MAG: glycoside hydrolase domain-containing protein [Nocardioidaceae bacterium]